jgi:mono/diheme cytochrome c family protein
MAEASTRLIVKTAVLTLLAAGALGAAAGLLVWRAGWYNIGATTPHLGIVYTGLEQAMRYSVQHHARKVAVPALGEADVARGGIVYRDNCAQCHGGPGVAPNIHGLSMQPAPGPLVDAPMRWQSRELYWITRHGVKMSGMPAWEFRLSDADTWAVVAFMNRMPTMTVADYKTLTAMAPAEGQAQARDPAAGEAR